MSNNLKGQIAIIGAGPMAQAYVQVLQAMKLPFVVIGRGSGSATLFESKFGVPVHTGGLGKYLQSKEIPAHAIVATGMEMLESCAIELMEAGCRSILLEKPGAINRKGLLHIQEIANATASDIIIAYNRRYYTSVKQVREMIAADDGLRAVYFEFTEWAHVIAPLQKGNGVKEHWFLANSTHVADLAFHFAGLPKDWSFYTAGGLDWHPSASRFAGSGVTENDIMFNYGADWEAPGRWGLELLTAKRRLILRPMEQLQVQQKGSVVIEAVKAVDTLDQDFKPGLYVQVDSWLKNDKQWACTLDEHLRAMPVYEQMANYKQEN